MQSEQKSEEKATLTKLPHVSPPAPDKKGETKTCLKDMYFSMERDKLNTSWESLLSPLAMFQKILQKKLKYFFLRSLICTFHSTHCNHLKATEIRFLIAKWNSNLF